MTIEQLHTATFMDLFRLWRFAGYEVGEGFDNPDFNAAFDARWKVVAPAPGSPEWVATSKAIGW